ncbi:chemotaxis protein CheX [Paenibacillus sp. sgz500958]|uniref:chemotaxis protein CheX n=1 Tax=Paenibacillus sp. sgz500958 TaxID=3242475 RepID=UPI0036D2777C
MMSIQDIQINAVVSGLEKVLTQYLGLSFRSGEPLLQQSSVHTDSVAVMVGMTGDVRGEIILSMDYEVLKGIVSVMCGFTVDSIDDMGWSAFGEFGNWVGAACCSAFNDLQMNTNITPPVLHEGKSNLRTSSSFISIPVYAGDLTLILHLSLGE